MRQRQPAQLDMRAVFEAAHDGRREAPAEWAQFLMGSSLARDDGWHGAQPADRWCWHASTLWGCPRKAIMSRAGYAKERERVESLNTFDIGHLYHVLAQFGMSRMPQYEDFKAEFGGYHPTINLAARADALYRHDGVCVILDFKTESTFSGRHRRKQAKEAGLESAARPEHAGQLKATAMVVAAATPDFRPTEGWIVYIDKESGDIDQQHVDLEDFLLHEEVLGRVANLDGAWLDYIGADALPEKLAAGHWNCRPRSDTDKRGMYCQQRYVCQETM